MGLRIPFVVATLIIANSACAGEIVEGDGKLKRIQTMPDSEASDMFMAAYRSLCKADKFMRDGKGDLAKPCCEDVIARLTLIQQSAPDWYSKIVAHRLERAEKLLAKIK
jgi:hypothetical protein